MSENPLPIDLLESEHLFPGTYRIKAIGSNENDFEGRAQAAVLEEIAVRGDLEITTRLTPGGRHIALTLEMNVQSADQVRAIYARLRGLEGLILLL